MYFKSFNTFNLNFFPAQANNSRLLLRIFWGVLFFVSICSCSKKNDEEPTPKTPVVTPETPVVKSGEASISKISFTVNGNDYKASISEEVVTVTLPSGTTIPAQVKITTLEHSSKANPSVKQGGLLPVKEGKATLTVTAEDGKTTKTFTINFVVLPYSEASINKISFTVDSKNYEASISGEVITVNLPTGTTIPAQVSIATLEHSPKASSSVKQGGDLKVSDGKASLTVTSEDEKTTKTYTINFVAQPSSAASISEISFTVGGNNYSSTISGEDITVNLPFGTTIPAQVSIATLEHSPNAVPSPDQGEDLSVSNDQATITVTAQDGTTTKTYTINFVVQLSSEALITSLVLEISTGNDETIDFGQGTTASVELPFGTSIPTTVKVKTLTYSAEAESSVDQGNNLTITNDKAEITITAQDGTTTKTYTVNFVVQPSSDALITSLVLTISGNDETIDFMQGTTASVELPFGSTIPAQVNVKTLMHSTNAVSSPDQGDMLSVENNGQATITVTAEDGTTTKTYTINFSVESGVTVTFNINGTITTNPEMEKGNKVTKPMDPMPPTGKVFSYWATSEVSNANYGNDKFDFNSTIDNDITLYAIWKEKPADKAALISLINEAIRVQGNTPNLNFIDTGLIMDMSELFKGYKTFNGNISEWNTSLVITMEKMFNNAEAFDGDISEWNTSQVNNMAHMFNNAKVFNQDIGDWNTGEVTDMQAMFIYARAFNQDIGDWDMRNVTITSWMFLQANEFNGDIQNWDTRNIMEMNGMFIDTYAFNQDISGWTVAQVTTFTDIFRGSGIEDNHKPMKFR